jgi:hypothetical protein
MITISYGPPDQEAQQWEVAEDSWTIAEIKLIEKHFGGSRKDFFDAVGEGYVTAMSLLLWVVRRRDEPTLTLGELDDLKVPYLVFAQHFPEQEDEEADPKDMPSESAPEPDSSSNE